MTTLCIAHGTPTTGYPGEARDFAHCGACARALEMQFGADPSIPRHKDGRPLSATSKLHRQRKEDFIRHLEAGVERAIIQQQTGLGIGDAAREFPFALSSIARRVHEYVA